MRVSWSHSARDDLRDIRDHIARDSPFYSRRFVHKIIQATGRLVSHPRLGRRVPEAQRTDVRELFFQSYRIMYLLCPDHVYILAIVHGSRDLAGRTPMPWEVV